MHAQFLIKKVSKQKGAMLDCSKLQSDGRITEAALQQDAKPWFRYIFANKSFQLQQGTSNAQRLDQGSS